MDTPTLNSIDVLRLIVLISYTPIRILFTNYTILYTNTTQIFLDICTVFIKFI